MTTASRDPRGPRWLTALYIAGWVFLLVLAFLLATSCGVSKPQVVVRDSVRVEVHERVVHDTAFFAISGDFQERTGKDTVSVLKNEYAQSCAAVEGGLLTHSLQTFPKTVKVPVTVTVHDTIRVESSTVTEFVDGPRQPTKWEGFVEVCGYILLGVLALCIVALALKLAI